MKKKKTKLNRRKLGEIPPGPKVCPSCRHEMNLEFSGYVFYGGVDGPYIHTRISFKCTCNYRETRSFSSQQKRDFAKAWKIANVLEEECDKTRGRGSKRSWRLSTSR